MEEITKEWPIDFLVPVEQKELSDPDVIRSPLVTQTKYDSPSSAKIKKKKEEVQDIDSEENNNALEETVLDSPAGGGGDEVNQEEEGEADKQEEGEVTSLKDPLVEAKTSKKRKGS
jgi:hypothetical protein